MDGYNIEQRTAMWAVAEICWEDPSGTPYRAPATLEDTSPSGACIRVKSPIQVGSRLVVKWHREHFAAIARNCRSDGRGYLLGVRRDMDPSAKEFAARLAAAAAAPDPATVPAKDVSVPAAKVLSASPPPELISAKSALPLAAAASTAASAPAPSRRERYALPHSPAAKSAAPTPRRPPQAPEPARSSQIKPEGASPRRERKVMESKGFFPNFWRKQDDSDAPSTATFTEAPVNKSTIFTPAEGLTSPPSDLLSYEDIYRAAGILGSRSGYGIHKVVDMLNSDRIRDLSKEVKRASVLMALDAAGTSVDDLLQDATRRQQALSSYEGGQQRQLDEFEARKTQENAQIQAEMDRVTAHYAERIQRNQDQLSREKETLRNWQMQKQHESQRIAKVIEVCGKQMAAAVATDVTPAPTSPRLGPEPARTTTPLRSTLLPEVSTGR